MEKIKINCPLCGQSLKYKPCSRVKELKCPYCKQPFYAPAVSPKPKTPPRESEKPVSQPGTKPETSATKPETPRKQSGRHRKTRITAAILGIVILLLMVGAVVLWKSVPAHIHWPDRRPIGVLFLASHAHSSAINPRGWFNNPDLDVTGTNGFQAFRKALFDYTDRSIENLKRTGAQGVIVWDLEGEQYPHKTSFIGDPRLVNRLAPEMAPVVDEFFSRLRDAGLRVGVTIRPQQIIFGSNDVPHQTMVLDTKMLLLAKIDYARNHWGATLFYVDSNDGFWRPDELWQLREVAAERPDILLIPEHFYLPYRAFSAPYVALRKSQPARSSDWARLLFPDSFEVLDISDATDQVDDIKAARLSGDVLLFRAWYWNKSCELLEGIASQDKPAFINSTQSAPQ